MRGRELGWGGRKLGRQRWTPSSRLGIDGWNTQIWMRQFHALQPLLFLVLDPAVSDRPNLGFQSDGVAGALGRR